MPLISITSLSNNLKKHGVVNKNINFRVAGQLSITLVSDPSIATLHVSFYQIFRCIKLLPDKCIELNNYAALDELARSTNFPRKELLSLGIQVFKRL